MYIVAKGECSVRILNEENKMDPKEKPLRIGAYFGEIALIYGCRRTCSVISKKYSTLAKLTLKDYKKLIQEIPELQL